MKKKILITIAVLALFVLVFASCGGGGPSCEHEWELTTTTANCTQAGEGTYVCSLCQASETKDVAALGHDFPDEPNETKIATCIEGGYSLYICQREGCGHEEQKHPTDPDASNHSYKTQQASPTCTEPGFTVSQCEWCEQFDNDRVPLPALGHTFTRENPTGITIHEGECEKEGYISYKCQECDLAEIVKTYGDLTGADATEEDKALAEAAKLAPLEHSFTFIADPTTDLVLPTCTEPGHTVYTCANGCGAKQSTAGTADEVSPLGHTYNRVGSTVVYVVKEESTCCKEGFKIAQCQDCQHEATVEEYTANEDLKQVIATIAHFTGKGGDDYIELTYHEADCENDSYWDVKCALDPNCTYGTGNNGEAVATRKGSNFVEALDHEWEIYTAVLTDGNPTCLTEGEWRYLCTRCDVYLMGSEAAKNGISGTELLAKGYTVDKNGDALKENLTGDAVKHKLGECVVQPTCYSRGIFACTVCPRRDVVNYEDDIDYDYHTNNEIGHTRVIEVVDPTCHSVGYTVYGCDHDEKCPYTEKDSYVAMANHTFKPVTLDGVLVCTECNKAYRDVTSAVWQSETKDFCICGTCDENKVMCGASVGASGSTYPKAPDTIVAGVANTFNLVDGDDGKYIAENIGKGIIEINGVTGASFTVKIYNGDTDVSGETLVKLTVTADENGKAYLFLYDVDSVTKVEITTEVEGSTVSFYAVKEEF